MGMENGGLPTNKPAEGPGKKAGWGLKIKNKVLNTVYDALNVKEFNPKEGKGKIKAKLNIDADRMINKGVSFEGGDGIARLNSNKHEYEFFLRNYGIKLDPETEKLYEDLKIKFDKEKHNKFTKIIVQEAERITGAKYDGWLVSKKTEENTSKKENESLPGDDDKVKVIQMNTTREEGLSVDRKVI
jgi:hypothetical protein